MKREQHGWHSASLDKHMDILTYGEAGQNFLVFPTSGGRFFDWEGFSMVSALTPYIEEGWVQLTCVDSVDNESWYNYSAPPAYRALRHAQYDNYIYQEVVPFMRRRSGSGYIATTGCSFGGYHAANFGLKHPDVVSKIVSLHGLMDIKSYVHGHYDENVYFNNPVDYIPNLSDDHILSQIRQERIILLTTAHDNDDHQRLSGSLHAKGISHVLDAPPGSYHDWPYWKEYIVKCL